MARRRLILDIRGPVRSLSIFCTLLLLAACGGSNKSSSLINVKDATTECQPASLRCDGNELQQCRSEGKGFLVVETCTNGCNATTLACNAACKAGSTKCDNDDLLTCADDGSGFNRSTCEKGCNVKTSVCNVTCKPGDVKCEGETLVSCNEDGTGWKIESCIHGCNQAVLPAACHELCRPGEQKCDGDKLLTCNATGDSFSEQACIGGCDTTTTTCHDPMTVTVEGDRPISSGDTLTLKANAEGGSGTYTYTWFDGATEVGTGETVDVTPDQTTTYKVVVKDSEGHTASAEVKVEVTTVLNASAGDDQQIARGQTATLKGTVTGGIGDTTCYWTTAGIKVADGCEIIVAPGVDTTYTLIAMDEAGHIISDEVLVKVFEPLVATAKADDAKLLKGQGTTINVTISGGVMPYSCLWDDDGASTDCSKLDVTPSETRTYTVTITDGAGNVLKASETVEVGEFFALAPEEARICLGPNAKLTIVGGFKGGIGTVQCAWYNGTDLVANGCTYETGVIPQDGTVLTLKVMDEKGNVAEAKATVKSAKPLGFEQYPPAQTDVVIGEGLTVNAKSLVFGGFRPITCEYKVGNTVVYTNCDDQILAPDQSTSYVLSVSDGTCAPVDTPAFGVKVHDKPALTVPAYVQVKAGAEVTKIAFKLASTHPKTACGYRLEGATTITGFECQDGDNVLSIPTPKANTKIEIIAGVGTTPYDTQSVMIYVFGVHLAAEPLVLDPGSMTKLTPTVVGNVGAVTCEYVDSYTNTVVATNDCTALDYKPKHSVKLSARVKDAETGTIVNSAAVAIKVNLKVNPIADIYVVAVDNFSIITGTYLGGLPSGATCAWYIGDELKKSETCGTDGSTFSAPNTETIKITFKVGSNGQTDSVTFTLWALKATAYGEPLYILAGQTAVLSVVVSGSPKNNLECAWSDGQTTFTTNDCSSIKVTPGYTTTYSVTITDLDTKLSLKRKVAINVKLVAGASDKIYISDDGKFSLNGAFNGGLPPYTAEWKDAKGNVVQTKQLQAGATSDVYSGTIPDTTYFELWVTDANKAQVLQRFDVFVMKASINATATQIKLGESVTLQAIVGGNGGGYTCTYTERGTTTTYNNCIQLLTPKQTTTYDLLVTSGTQTAKASVTILVYNLSIGLSPEPLYRGQELGFTYTYSGASGDVICRLSLSFPSIGLSDSKQVDNCTTIPYTPWVDGSYVVEIEDKTSGLKLSKTGKITVGDPCTNQTKDGLETATDHGGPMVFFNELIPWANLAVQNVRTGFEIAGPSGLNLTGWRVVQYAPTGYVSEAFPLGGALPKSDTSLVLGFFDANPYIKPNDTLEYPAAFALVDSFGRVHEFVSLGGVITGQNGPAQGYTSQLIPADETLSTQRIGIGDAPLFFDWVTAAPTQGNPSQKQTLTGGGTLVYHAICTRAEVDETCQTHSDCSTGACLPNNKGVPVCAGCAEKPPLPTSTVPGGCEPPANLPRALGTATFSSPNWGLCEVGPTTFARISIDAKVGDVLFTVKFAYPVAALSFNSNSQEKYELAIETDLGVTLPMTILLGGMATHKISLPLPVYELTFRLKSTPAGPTTFDLNAFAFAGPLCLN